MTPGALLMHSANRLNTSKPANNTNANSVFESLPPLQRALNTTLKTNVYTANIRTGLKNDQKIPRNEPLYRPTTSRFTIALIKLRLHQKLFTSSFGEIGCACISQIPL